MTSPPASPSLSPDAALWERLCAGDAAALSRLYREAGGRLLRFVERLSGSRAVAEDVLQDVFLAVIDGTAAAGAGARGGRGGHDAPGGYDPARGSLRSYLFGMARNAGLKRMRDLRPPAIDTGPRFGARLDDDEQAVRAALGRLDPIFREVVLLCDLEGLRYDEAATALQIPVGTVRSRLARGRARLVEQLSSDAPRATPAAGEEAR